MTKAYDFTKSGTGEYSVEPSNLFTIVDADGTLKDIYATVWNTAKVKLSGDLPVPRVHDKRTTFGSCSSKQQSQLEAAVDKADNYAAIAYNYIADISSGTTRYTTWFGEYDGVRKNTIDQHFESIDAKGFSELTYDCTCTDTDTLAYVGVYTSRA